MKNPIAVDLGSTHDLVAYVLQGDLENPERTWVCVGARHAPTHRSWLGCWSHENIADVDIRDFLASLRQEVEERALVGPQGTWLGGIYFFSGWDSWGPGIPAPLEQLTPETVMRKSTEERSIGEVKGIE